MPLRGGGKSLGGVSHQKFQSGAILKRDRLVSGLLQINVAHLPHLWQDNRKSIMLPFVDAMGGVYSAGAGGGYTVKIFWDVDDYSIIWFNDRIGVSAPVDGSADEIVECNIQAYLNVVGSANDVAAKFLDTCQSAILDDHYYCDIGNTTVGEKRNDHIVYLTRDYTNIIVSASEETVNHSDFKISEFGGTDSFEMADAVTTETDFKQALFNNAGKDLLGVPTYTNRSPFESNEKAPWRGELYDDGRFDTGSNDDPHPTKGRNIFIDENGEDHWYNASLGDHCTYLYFVTAATKVSNKLRPWGIKVKNSIYTELLTQGLSWRADFDTVDDISYWTIRQGFSGSQLTSTYHDTPTRVNDPPNQVPLNTGVMNLHFAGGLPGDENHDFGIYNTHMKTMTLTSGNDYYLSWVFDRNSSASLILGAGKVGIDIRTHQTWELGTSIASEGMVIGGGGVSAQGRFSFTAVTTTELYVFIQFLPTGGTGAGGDTTWTLGTMDVLQMKMYKKDAIQYQDVLNLHFNTSLSDEWYTEKPDDGGTFLWIRSHLLSVQNNSEPYDDKMTIKSRRVKFTATTDSDEEAGTISIGSDAVYEGSYIQRGADVVDNYNYRQWKNYKPGDIIKVSGAADSANNGIFQLRWDWDHNSEYFYGYTTTDTPVDGSSLPNMKFRLCPIRIIDNGTTEADHTFVTTNLLGQLFQEDITITTGGAYGANVAGTKVPLIFTATPAVDIAGYAYISDTGGFPIFDVEISNPGTGFTLASANTLAITVETVDGEEFAIMSIAAAGTGYSSIETGDPHGYEFEMPIELKDMVETYYNGDYIIQAIVDDTHFIIEKVFTITSFGVCNTIGAAAGSQATFSHTATSNLNTSPIVTIENLTRRYQDSSNSKTYDYTIPATIVDAPPPDGVDTHAVPYTGRYGNQGRVSSYNHMYDSYSSDFTGMFKTGKRSEMWTELHEYEGRKGTHHMMETWHNPVAGIPEIYGERELDITHQYDVFNRKIVNKFGNLVNNSDFIMEFSNGKFGVGEGSGYASYQSPHYGKLFNITDIVLNKPKLLVMIPLKGYVTLKEDGSASETEDTLYDTNIEVMWKPFGETNQIQLTKGDNANDNEMND